MVRVKKPKMEVTEYQLGILRILYEKPNVANPQHIDYYGPHSHSSIFVLKDNHNNRLVQATFSALFKFLAPIREQDELRNRKGHGIKTIFY